MIVEKGHFHFADKYWGGGKALLAPLFRRPLFNKMIQVTYEKMIFLSSYDRSLRKTKLLRIRIISDYEWFFRRI